MPPRAPPAAVAGCGARARRYDLGTVDLPALGRLLVALGVALAALGAGVILLPKLGLTRLPGDLSLRVGNMHVYLPIASSILLSIVLTLLLRWLGGRR